MIQVKPKGRNRLNPLTLPAQLTSSREKLPEEPNLEAAVSEKDGNLVGRVYESLDQDNVKRQVTVKNENLFSMMV